MVQSNLKLIDVSLQLLLQPESLSLTLGLGFQTGLHGVQSTLVVLSGVLKFLFLLLDATVDLLAHLGQFQLAAQHLVLLLFKSCLSLFQSSLQFILLNLQALPGLLDLMDVAATLTNLVQKIFDLIGQVLVLTAHSFQLFLSFLIGALETEQLCRVVAALLLAGVKLCSQVINLQLPFTNNLVKCLLLLLSSICNSSGTVYLQLQVFNFGAQSLLGLFQGYNLLVQRLNGLLSLSKPSL